MHGMQAATIAKKMIIFIIRMICFSVIAACPVYFVRPYILRAFSGFSNRLIVYGIPVLITALIFAITGIVLLVLFKDETAYSITRKIKNRRQNKQN